MPTGDDRPVTNGVAVICAELGVATAANAIVRRTAGIDRRSVLFIGPRVRVSVVQASGPTGVNDRRVREPDAGGAGRAEWCMVRSTAAETRKRQ
jgi:hypothetical protein